MYVHMQYAELYTVTWLAIASFLSLWNYRGITLNHFFKNK